MIPASVHPGTWETIISLATTQSRTIATAESCTGGGIGYALTAIPGSSRVFLGGVIAYANEIKRHLLGVSEEILSSHGAVSFATCEAMLLGVQRLFAPSYAIATTGIAGPEGGTPQKPVGTVFIGIATHEVSLIFHCLFAGGREEIRTQTIDFAGSVVLSLLRGETPPESLPFIIETKRTPLPEDI